MQSAELANERIPRAQMEMIRVRENHLRTHRFELERIERLDARQRADRHERRRRDVAVRRRENPRPRMPIGRANPKRERHSKILTPVRCQPLPTHTTTIASPYE